MGEYKIKEFTRMNQGEKKIVATTTQVVVTTTTTFLDPTSGEESSTTDEISERTDNSSESEDIPKSHSKPIKRKSLKFDLKKLGPFSKALPDIITLQRMLKQRLKLSPSQTMKLITDYCAFISAGYTRDDLSPEAIENGRKADRKMKTATTMRAMPTHAKDTMSENIVHSLNHIHMIAFPRVNPNSLVDKVLQTYSTPAGSRKKNRD
jgi:hypothetical protein